MIYFFPFSIERRNTTLIFLPQLNTISVCEACASSECPNCRPLSNISGLKGSQISKGTRKLSTSTSLILILLLVPAIILSEFYNWKIQPINKGCDTVTHLHKKGVYDYLVVTYTEYFTKVTSFFQIENTFYNWAFPQLIICGLIFR